MGHDHIRFVLMAAFFSACVMASFGSEMGITRFSATYTSTHPERVVQLTESISRSKKVTIKVASSPDPPVESGSAFRRARRRRTWRMRTAKEFQMRRHQQQHQKGCEIIEKKSFTLPESAATIAHGTRAPDQQDFCSSPAQQNRGGQCKDREENRKEFTVTYSNSGSSYPSPVCQKVSFFSSQLNLVKWATEERSDTGPVKQHQPQQEKSTLPDDHPSKPIFFVYPPSRRVPEKENVAPVVAVEGNDDEDGMDDYEPTFHLEFSSIGSPSTSRFPKYDPRINGGFDSYGENVPFYFDRISGAARRHALIVTGTSTSVGRKGSRKSNVANASSFDELCRALLLDYG